MGNNRGASKNTILIAILLIVLLVAGAGLVRTLTKKGSEIKLTADGYNLLVGTDYGERPRTRIDDKDQVEQLNKMLSGKYIEGKHLTIINTDVMDYVCMVTPMYMTRDYKAVDDYAETVYHEDTKDGHVIYGESIYIINKRTIGFWDAETDDIWIGKKVDGEIDTELLKKLMSD